MGAVFVVTAMFGGASRPDSFLEAPYGIFILLDSVFFAIFLFSVTMWLCLTSPLVPSTVITILASLWNSIWNASNYGDWGHFSSLPVVAPVWIVAGGSVLFSFFHGMRYILFMKRAVFISVLVGVALAISFRVSRTAPLSYPRHPISDLIYKAQIAHDHWVKEATVSSNIRAGAHIYQQRHDGRLPPPNFDAWYEYAQGATIIDTFEQIDEDLSPFWSYPPEVLRERAEAMTSIPGVFAIIIRNGKVTYSDAGNREEQRGLQELSETISKFSKHLPDMTIPINLGPSPRVLPVWEETYGQGQGRFGWGAGPSKRWLPDMAEGHLDPREVGLELDAARSSGALSPFRFRNMLINACAPNSKSRKKMMWDFAALCPDCVERHSKHEFLVSWNNSMEICEQPDLLNLHEMFLTSSDIDPIQDLGPLFSFSKTDAFGDILIPLPGPTLGGGEPDIKWEFKRRYDSLFWRGNIGHQDGNGQVLRASPKYRLLHLLLDPGSHEEVVVVRAGRGRDVNEFGYEAMPASEANSLLSFDVGMNGLSECSGYHCEIVRQAFEAMDDNQEPLEYRYVLLVDEKTSKPEQLMRAIRSKSMPMVSTIFRSWYTERLRPYLHLVPIDMRFHGLHTTYLYFTESANQVKYNKVSSGPGQVGSRDDGEWIALQGQKWAEKAIGEKDMEAYLFRLLLEWGRLIHNDRDNIGFRAK
ncbi:Glycosyltransferase family 90 protein [Geosmithia morbida]|uniref:Glycosyltransferase family 90 protein n=1 Tax=Geosmithia morbida TaxID=1094350 RepID=A0A9P4YS40_9HYPO|nr:Glycosyltransferase family 90 protein [Geosmithia morbida]KAF4121740.1 Glycosyltransferase family 90 protein [Geosmithia morbida]